MDKIEIRETEILSFDFNIFDFNIEEIEDSRLKEIFRKWMNYSEAQASEIKELKEENQKLKDEINRLKGEQGKPSIRKQTQGKSDISSEKERKEEKKKKKRMKKVGNIDVHRTQICQVDKSILPSDAIFKGYEPTVIQDILILPNNTEFKREIYYSPSLNKTFLASLPKGYSGEFGPNIKALVLDLHHNSKMTQSSIHQFFKTHGIFISQGTIAKWLIKEIDLFHKEKREIVQSGLSYSFFHQMDDTGARVKGKNHFTHILCNSLFTAYFTRPHKDRLTIIDILTQGEMFFHFNESSYALMEQMGVSEKTLKLLQEKKLKEQMTREEIEIILNECFQHPKRKYQTQRQAILEATAITAYQSLPHAIELLLTDDAPQFKQITELLALCWIHDGRHYKKLSPFLPIK
jgi:hypothetical protein